MHQCAIYVVIVTLMATTAVAGTSSVCYVGTAENAALEECVPPRSRRQSEITRPVIGNDTEEPMPATTAVPPANVTQAQNRENSTCNTTSPQDAAPTPRLANVTATASAVLQDPPSCVTLVATNRTFYDCDYRGYCNPGFDRGKRVVYKGLLVSPFCCRGVGCNDARNDTAQDATTTLKCFQAANKKALACPSSGWVCVNSTAVGGFPNHTTGAVDYACLRLNSSACNGSAAPQCVTDHSPHGWQVKTCCCATDHCNAPPIAAVASGDGTSDPFNSVKWVVYGCVVGMSSCIVAGTTTLIYKWRRRRLEDEDSSCIINNPRFQRLAANFTAGDTDDVKMLLADPEC